MKKALEWGKVGVLIAAVCGSLAYKSNVEWSQLEKPAIENSNTYLNKTGELWHVTNNPVNGVIPQLKDGTGTVFYNVPAKSTDKQIIEHFKKKPEYKDHNFYPQEYMTIEFGDMDNGEAFNKNGGCVTWQYYVDHHASSIVGVVREARNDYVNGCGWNEYVDLSYSAPMMENIKYKIASYETWFDWGIFIGLLLCVPVAWLGFFKGVGMAYRSARKSFKGDKE